MNLCGLSRNKWDAEEWGGAEQVPKGRGSGSGPKGGCSGPVPSRVSAQPAETLGSSSKPSLELQAGPGQRGSLLLASWVHPGRAEQAGHREVCGHQSCSLDITMVVTGHHTLSKPTRVSRLVRYGLIDVDVSAWVHRL